MPMYTCKCRTCHVQVTVFRHLSEWGKWPYHCRRKMVQVIQKPTIIKDIEPYKAVGFDVATGRKPVITSRAHHKNYLRDNGYEEVGNEPIREQDKAADKLGDARDDVVKNLKKVTGRPV